MSLGTLFDTSPQIVFILPLVVVIVEVDKVQTEAVKLGSAAVLRRPDCTKAPSSKMLRLVLKSWILGIDERMGPGTLKTHEQHKT